MFLIDNAPYRGYTEYENGIDPIGEATTGIRTAAAKQWRHCQMV